MLNVGNSVLLLLSYVVVAIWSGATCIKSAMLWILPKAIQLKYSGLSTLSFSRTTVKTWSKAASAACFRVLAATAGVDAGAMVNFARASGVGMGLLMRSVMSQGTKHGFSSGHQVGCRRVSNALFLRKRKKTDRQKNPRRCLMEQSCYCCSSGVSILDELIRITMKFPR